MSAVDTLCGLAYNPRRRSTPSFDRSAAGDARSAEGLAAMNRSRRRGLTPSETLIIAAIVAAFALMVAWRLVGDPSRESGGHAGLRAGEIDAGAPGATASFEITVEAA